MMLQAVQWVVLSTPCNAITAKPHANAIIRVTEQACLASITWRALPKIFPCQGCVKLRDNALHNPRAGCRDSRSNQFLGPYYAFRVECGDILLGKAHFLKHLPRVFA